MSLELLPYVPEDAELWDEFCASALQFTLFFIPDAFSLTTASASLIAPCCSR